MHCTGKHIYTIKGPLLLECHKMEINKSCCLLMLVLIPMFIISIGIFIAHLHEAKRKYRNVASV